LPNASSLAGLVMAMDTARRTTTIPVCGFLINPWRLTEIAQSEWVEQGKSYREWLIPGQLVNCSKSAEIVTVE